MFVAALQFKAEITPLVAHIPLRVTQVRVPLQMVSTCPLDPGLSRLHPLPFQYIIWFTAVPF